MDLCTPGTPHLTSPIYLVLSSLSDIHLVNVLSDVGVSFDRNVGSPSSLLSLVCANEVALAANAKAKEPVAEKVLSSSRAPVDPVGVGCGLPSLATVKRVHSKRPKSCIAPCRSSLRFKNLSFK
jgi:hypothetical protein